MYFTTTVLDMDPTSSPSSSSIDLYSGFCSVTKVFHSLRPEIPFPWLTSKVSVTDYVFSLLRNFLHTGTCEDLGIIDAGTGHVILYPELIRRTENLASFFYHRTGLRKGEAALILSPNSLHVPVLYLALLSLGVITSPSNPTSTPSELSRQIQLCKPVIAFSVSSAAHKIPPLLYRTVLLDTSDFKLMMTSRIGPAPRVDVAQSDPATILYSSGTTGKVKGVTLTHRNWTASIAAALAMRPVRKSGASPVSFCTAPYFHVYGFSYSLRAVSFGESLVLMERVKDVKNMMSAIDKFKVTHLAVAPPLVVAMVKNGTDCHDLSSLEVIFCGGAALAKGVIERFYERFPNLQLAQSYGLTETTAGITRTVGPEECKVVGAIGRLVSYCQAKIVDPQSGDAQHPLGIGEIWFRGPVVMKGYVGDENATAAVPDSYGWLRTGDLGYIDNAGYFYFVDRIKELIKYKAYQVAPAELEHILQSHPEIVEAAVIPYPDEEAGQVPMAFVVRQPRSAISESQIKAFVAEQVAPYKKVRRVAFIHSIPKNVSGKTLRRELVNLALSSSSSKL